MGDRSIFLGRFDSLVRNCMFRMEFHMYPIELYMFRTEFNGKEF